MCDVFATITLGYRRNPAVVGEVLALEKALLDDGVEVWRDDRNIAQFGHI